MTDIKVKVLRTVRVAHPGTVYGREIIAGTYDEVPAELVEDLIKAGYIDEPSDDGLRDDGPTVADLASNYPPKGYASRSTVEEIEAAVAAEEAAKEGQIDGGTDLAKMTKPQLHELAAAEGIAVETDNNKQTLIDKIVAARAAAAA